MSGKTEKEQQPPTRLKNTDFDMIHKQIGLEQELNKLKPFIAYQKLLANKEDSKIATLKDPTDDNFDWDTILEELIEKNEYGRTDNPKKATREDWLDYYNFMYNYIAKKTEHGEDIGAEMFMFLYKEKKMARMEAPRMEDFSGDFETSIRYNAVNTVINEKKKEFPEQHLSYEKMRDPYNVLKRPTEQKKCDENEIGMNNQKRLYYLRMNHKMTNSLGYDGKKKYEDLSRKEKREMLEKVKKQIVKINEKEAKEYREVEDKGSKEGQLKRKALEDKLKEIGFYFDPVETANYSLNFYEKPSIEKFLEADKVIQKKCPNILDDDMRPFLSKDPSEMGGHPGAFINIYVPKDGDKKCTVYGGKKWDGDSRVEYNFYQYIYKNKIDPLLLSFKKYIPEYIKDKKCKPFWGNVVQDSQLKEFDYYFPIANIKNIVRKENEKIQTADFKIGYRTSFLHEKGKKGNKGGVIRDKFHSISDKLGFRLEGSSLINKINKISRKHAKLSGWHTTPLEGRMKKFGKSIKPISKETDFLGKWDKKGKFKIPQFNLYVLNPGFIFDTIFHNQTDKNIKVFQEKLKIFEKDFIQKNFNAFNNGEKAIAFIGSSFFFVSGGNGIDFKLIDFAHPYLLSWEEKDGKRVLSDSDDLCCPTYLEDGKPIPGLKNKSNKMAVKYNYKKKVGKKKIDAGSTGVEGVKSATNVIANVAQSGGGWWAGKGESVVTYNIDEDENKRDLTYKEWEHTFFNFMSGLLSMIYSFHLWANSRLHYKLSDDNIRKRNIAILRKSYFSELYKRPVQKIKKDLLETWMDVPDNIDMSNYKADKDFKKIIEKRWDEPYRWDESIKITQFNALIVNSQSNLTLSHL